MSPVQCTMGNPVDHPGDHLCSILLLRATTRVLRAHVIFSLSPIHSLTGRAPPPPFFNRGAPRPYPTPPPPPELLLHLSELLRLPPETGRLAAWSSSASTGPLATYDARCGRRETGDGARSLLLGLTQIQLQVASAEVARWGFSPLPSISAPSGFIPRIAHRGGRRPPWNMLQR
jgi:hypothetical protein